MSCGCKNKTQVEPKPQIIQANGVNEIKELTQPLYTIEEVIRIKDWLNSRNKQDSERIFALQFNEIHFGEIVPGYCDQSCIERIRRRMDYCEQKLIEYEQYKSNG